MYSTDVLQDKFIVEREASKAKCHTIDASELNNYLSLWNCFICFKWCFSMLKLSFLYVYPSILPLQASKTKRNFGVVLKRMAIFSIWKFFNQNYWILYNFLCIHIFMLKSHKLILRRSKLEHTSAVIILLKCTCMCDSSQYTYKNIHSNQNL